METKMVSIELRECYVRNIAVAYKKALTNKINQMDLPETFFIRCLEWHEANPETKQMRAMTTEEKLNWLMPRLQDNIILILKDGIGYYCKKGEDISIGSLSNAIAWVYNGERKNFEVEVEE